MNSQCTDIKYSKKPAGLAGFLIPYFCGEHSGSMLFPVQIQLCILKKAYKDQKDDEADGEGCNNGYGLQVCHGAFGKDQGNGKQHQGNGPEQLNPLIRLLLCMKGFIGIGGCYHGKGIKGGSVKGDHGHD